MVEAEKVGDRPTHASAPTCSDKTHYSTNAAYPTRSERGKHFDQHSWLDRIHMDNSSKFSKMVRAAVLTMLWAGCGLNGVVTVALAFAHSWGALPYFILTVAMLVVAVIGTRDYWKSHEKV